MPEDMATSKAFIEAGKIANSRNTRLTYHSSETEDIVYHSKKIHGVGEIELLERIGFLNPDVLAVHCVWLTPRELRIFKARNVKVSHCPVANMYLGDGVAHIPEMLMHSLTVGLGTDGAASNNNQDMIGLLKHTALLHKVHNLDPTVMTAEKVLEMATIDGAKALGIDGFVGSLEPGKKADITILDGRKPNIIGSHNPVSSIVYCATQANVETVIINGKTVLQDGRFTTLKEKKIIENVSKTSEALIEKNGIPKPQIRWRSFAY